MSYILDALKKSEQEHKKGQVPGLGTVQGLPGPGGRFETDRLIWIYAMATILVAALAAGAWLFLRDPGPAQEKTAPSVIDQLPVDHNAAPPQTAKPATLGKVELKPAAPPPTPKSDKQPPSRPPVPRSGGQGLKTVKPETLVPPAPVAPAPEIEEAQPSPPKVEAPVPEQPPAEGNWQEEPKAHPNPELLVTVPIEELPAEIRAELPAIKIGVHLFSDTPASRRASINGRLMREGQEVDKELVLVEIIRQGAILSFRGRKFTVPVFPR